MWERCVNICFQAMIYLAYPAFSVLSSPEQKELEMAYGKLSFEQDERLLVLELLRTALVKNEALMVAAESEDEAVFYKNVKPALLAILEAVEGDAEKVPFTEDQLSFLKGLLSSSRSELREKFLEARATNPAALEDVNQQWALRDRLAAKLEKPFIADKSSDAEEGMFEED